MNERGQMAEFFIGVICAILIFYAYNHYVLSSELLGENLEKLAVKKGFPAFKPEAVGWVTSDFYTVPTEAESDKVCVIYWVKDEFSIYCKYNNDNKTLCPEEINENSTAPFFEDTKDLVLALLTDSDARTLVSNATSSKSTAKYTLTIKEKFLNTTCDVFISITR